MKLWKMGFSFAVVAFAAMGITLHTVSRASAQSFGEADCNVYTDWDEIDDWAPDDDHHMWGYFPHPAIQEPSGEWRFVDVVTASGLRHTSLYDGYTLSDAEHIQEPWDCEES